MGPLNMFNIARNIAASSLYAAIFERVAGNLLSVDGLATQLPAILPAILLDVDATLWRN